MQRQAPLKSPPETTDARRDPKGRTDSANPGTNGLFDLTQNYPVREDWAAGIEPVTPPRQRSRSRMIKSETFC